MATQTGWTLKFVWAVAVILFAQGAAFAELVRNGFDLAGALVPVEEILQEVVEVGVDRPVEGRIATGNQHSSPFLHHGSFCMRLCEGRKTYIRLHCG